MIGEDGRWGGPGRTTTESPQGVSRETVGVEHLTLPELRSPRTPGATGRQWLW